MQQMFACSRKFPLLYYFVSFFKNKMACTWIKWGEGGRSHGRKCIDSFLTSCMDELRNHRSPESVQCEAELFPLKAETNIKTITVTKPTTSFNINNHNQNGTNSSSSNSNADNSSICHHYDHYYHHHKNYKDKNHSHITRTASTTVMMTSP